MPDNFQADMLLDSGLALLGEGTEPFVDEVVPWLEKGPLFPGTFAPSVPPPFCPDADAHFIPVGGIVLNGLQFSTDPNPYEPLNWEKRYSLHPTIGGGFVIQDFGTFMRDNTLRLESGGEPRFLTDSAVATIHSLWRRRGQVFTFVDWLGNEFRVFIKDFRPAPYKRGGIIDHPNCEEGIWTYTMELQVTQIIKLFNVAYTGS